MPVVYRSIYKYLKENILRRDLDTLSNSVIEGQMPEVKGVGGRRTQLVDDLRNRRRYWELKEEAKD